MPELPEVETVIKFLRPKIINKRLTSFNLLWRKTLYTDNKQDLVNTIVNKMPKIFSIERHGKYIIINIEEEYLICHLRMTGYLYHAYKIDKKSKYIRCYFTLNDSSFLIYEDIRKFGGFYYSSSMIDIYKKTGIDPINDNLTIEWLSNNIRYRTKMIKALLLDQNFICGIGNIYADEILWLSKIHPQIPANKINKHKLTRLTKNISLVLRKSIEHHGTTTINFKFDNMKTGTYRKKLMVYGRENENCLLCYNQIIKRIKVSSRSTYICEKCQKY